MAISRIGRSDTGRSKGSQNKCNRGMASVDRSVAVFLETASRAAFAKDAMVSRSVVVCGKLDIE